MSPASLITWDARDAAWSRGPFLDRAAWLKAHGLPAHAMYRAEFYQGDVPFARIFCYALDGQGRRHWAPGHIQGPHDHDACGPAREEPRNVPLDELPPEALW